MLGQRLVIAFMAMLLLTLGQGCDEANDDVDDSNFKVFVYFGNWTPYRGFHPQALPSQTVSHVLYAFVNFGEDGTVFSGDEYADLEKRYDEDIADESGRNAYGCVNQLFQMKKDHRNMKVILSIGGWTWSANFSAVSSSSASRHVFATSAVSLMKDWGLDGLDIDWEFPLDKQEGLNFLELLRAVRHELDEYAAQHAPGHRFQLSIAAPAGKKHYENLPLAEMSAVVDSFNLMTYDFAGPWSDNAAHTANLYVDKSNPASTPYSIELAVQAYMETGVPSKKIVLGVPLFGRAFQNTQGLGHPFSGVGRGSWEKGTWDYKALPKLDATVKHDPQADADYTFDGHELISYDTPRAVRQKAGYVRDVGLGGLMFWEASADRNDSDSLVGTASRELRQVDVTKNWLSYPDSKFDNLG